MIINMPNEQTEDEFPEDPDCVSDDDYGPDNSDDEWPEEQYDDE